MKTARLIVKNFGPLKDINIMVTDFLCLIGKQATGKSTIAKLISIFEDENFEKELFVQNLKTYGLDQFITIDTFISYKIDEKNKNSILHFEFIFENENATLNNFKTYFTHFFEIESLNDAMKTSKLITDISTHLINGFLKYDDISAIEKVSLIIEDFEKKMKNFRLLSNEIDLRSENNDKEAKRIREQLNKLSKKILKNPSVELTHKIDDLEKNQENLKKSVLKVRHDINTLVQDLEKTIKSYYYDIVDFLKLDSQYIPSERSFLHIIAENIFGLINNNIQIPKHLLEIGQEYEKALNVVREIPLTLIDKKFRYKREGKTSYIYHGLEDRIDLLQSASGLQSILPIVLLIEYAKTLKDNYHFNYVIEEPELNIYPETQHELIKYLVKNIFNFSDNNFQRKKLVITTHSPYILASINNLLLAYQKGIQKPKETNRILKKEYWINPKFFNAYELKNGKSFKIVNDKIGQIKSNIIDKVSDSFSEEFDKLLAL